MILKSKSRVSPDSEGWTLEILRERNAENFPRWPNESMVKTLFGSYLREPISPLPSWKILDVGCGFANNLIPFAELGCKCFAVDLSEDMLQVARRLQRSIEAIETLAEANGSQLVLHLAGLGPNS